MRAASMRHSQGAAGTNWSGGESQFCHGSAFLNTSFTKFLPCHWQTQGSLYEVNVHSSSSKNPGLVYFLHIVEKLNVKHSHKESSVSQRIWIWL